MSEHLTPAQIRSYVERRGDADEILAIAQHLDVCFECRDRTAAIVDDRGDRHHDHVVPDHRPSRDEVDRCDAIDAEAEDVVEAVHLMEIGEADQTQRGEHQDAYAGAEVAAVYADEKLKRECEDEPRG